MGADFLKIGDALRFDALVLGFLRFFLKDEAHAQGVLFGLLLGFDRALQHGGQLNARRQEAAATYAAGRELWESVKKRWGRAKEGSKVQYFSTDLWCYRKL
jgi:hypothetical protein